MPNANNIVNTDLKFFTNEPERTLYDRFSVILQNNTQFFDILVGYFRTSGFFKLYPAMENIEKIRILIGLNTDKYTVEILDQALTLTTKESSEAFARQIEAEFEKSEHTENIEKGVLKFIEWLNCGKMEMRLYATAPIHAKVYIMRKNPQKADYYGSVITGSSNFSAAGLQNNLEFNVELKDSADVCFALERFEELWKDGIPITQTYIDAIQQKTWLRNDITPYEIFLKTLYEFFREEINADKDELAKNLLPPGYMQLQYQTDAVIQAKKTLQAYNGVFIADVVGLGKTYICAMLAKSLPKGKKLIICPPVLTDYWKEVLLDFDVAANVVSLGKLDSVLQNAADYDYIFVDEAHRFRNAVTEGFGKLHQICYGKKVVLISATPINNYSSDIENLISLFQPMHNSNIPSVKNLAGFFASLNGKLKGFDKGSQEYMQQLRANSEEIRTKVLRHIMIRRTRSEIEQYYKDDLAKQKLSFPKLGAPEKIVYEFDEKVNKAFDETIDAIKNFAYARYKPVTYLLNQQPYAKFVTAQQNMGGFMKSILVKRLESSFYAFKMTLARFIESYEKFIQMFEQGEVWISKKTDVYELLDAGDTGKLLDMLESEDAMHFTASQFRHEFIDDLQSDLKKLQHLAALWTGIDTDPKLETFCHELDTNKKLSGNKKIIFTESKETAEYLQEKLQELYGGRVVAFSGESSQNLKAAIEDSFNPKNEPKNNDRYDILITTDILAEGINLHRSNALINYDLPWNPTRIMQRVGRINRVGTQHKQIYVFNFFPTAQSSKQLSLKERIMEKLQAFHDTLGEDYKYLSDEEIVSPQKLFNDLTDSLTDEGESANPELKYLAIIRQVRDNDAKLFEKIKRLPKKSKTGRHCNKIKNDATITFIRKGALKDFYISGKATKQLSFIEAVKYLECVPQEPRLNVGSVYFEHYAANNAAFDIAQIEEKLTETAKAQLRGNEAKIIKVLNALQSVKTFTEDEEENIRRLRTAFQSGVIPPNYSKTIVKELKTAKDSNAAYFVIYNNVPERYLYGHKDVVLNIEGKKQVILSCFLKGRCAE